MDAAARAELAALRRRAYARDADIDGDSIALERLAELEELALRARPGAASAPSRTAVAPQAEAPTPAPLTHEAPASDLGGPPPRRPLIIGLVVSVTVLAVALGAVRGLQTWPDPTSPGAATASPTTRPAATDLTAHEPVTIPLLIDSRRGEFIDVSSRPDVPMFLTNGVTTWAQPLGVYYGWALWAAEVLSGQGPENCLLLTNGVATKTRCSPDKATGDGALGVSLAYDNLTEQQRPLDMTADQHVTFAWGGGAYMTMEIMDSR